MQCYNSGISWSKVGSDGVSRSCSQTTLMKGKWWRTCLIFSMSCLRGFYLRGRGMELYAKHATSRHIKWSEPIQSYKKDGMLFAFPQGPHQHYYYYAAAPRRHVKGRLSHFSTVWMIFYLLNVVLLLHEIYLFQSFPLAFIWGLSMELINA